MWPPIININPVSSINACNKFSNKIDITILFLSIFPDLDSLIKKPAPKVKPNSIPTITISDAFLFIPKIFKTGDSLFLIMHFYKGGELF